MPAEPTPENLLTVTAYGATNRLQQIIDAIRLLDELHGARELKDMDRLDSRCKTCRDSSGKPCPWPCETYLRFAELFQIPVAEDSIRLFHAIGRWRNGGPQPDWGSLTDAALAVGEQPAIGGAQ